MKESHILLTGINDPKKVEERLTDELIDIVGWIEISGSELRVSPDVGFDLKEEDDVDSFLDFVIGVLKEAGEDEFSTEIVSSKSSEERPNQPPEPTAPSGRGSS